MSDEPKFTNTPPDDATLVPVAAFKAFHNNFTGIPRTGEMKLSINIPVDDIHSALDVAGARDEILWVQVSKLRFTGDSVKQLAETIAKQSTEREQSRVKPAKKRKAPGAIPAAASELDWET